MRRRLARGERGRRRGRRVRRRRGSRAFDGPLRRGVPVDGCVADVHDDEGRPVRARVEAVRGERGAIVRQVVRGFAPPVWRLRRPLRGRRRGNRVHISPALNAAIELRAFLVNYHAGKAKAQAGGASPRRLERRRRRRHGAAGGFSDGNLHRLRVYDSPSDSLHAVDGEVRDDAVRLCDLRQRRRRGREVRRENVPAVQGHPHARPSRGARRDRYRRDGGRDRRRIASRRVPSRRRSVSGFGSAAKLGGDRAEAAHGGVPASVPYFCRREGSSEARAKRLGRVGEHGRVLSEYLG